MLLNRETKPTLNGCPVYVTKLHSVEDLGLELREMRSVSLLLLLPGSLWSQVYVPLKFPYMVVMDLFQNY